MRIKYFDTVPVCASICVLKSGLLFCASEFGNQLVTAHTHTHHSTHTHTHTHTRIHYNPTMRIIIDSENSCMDNCLALNVLQVQLHVCL